MQIKPEDIIFDDYAYVDKAKVKRSAAVMDVVWRNYLRTKLTLTYTCAAVIVALSGSR